MSPLKLNQITNSLEGDAFWDVSIGKAYNFVEPSTENLSCGSFDASGNHLYSQDYINWLGDISANFAGVFPPDEITDYELANMEMILFDNDISRFSSVD